MSADLPVVPEEAIRAVAGELDLSVDETDQEAIYDRRLLDRALRAALPHLYAASLRHAADRVEANYPPDVFLPDSTSRDADGARMARAVCAQLRRMADEAVQG